MVNFNEQTNIENPAVGSSGKKNIVRNIFRIFFIVIMLVILSFSYIFLFSGESKGGLLGAVATGVLDENKFVDANAGDLVIINKTEKVTDLEVGNIVVYQMNGQVSSAKILEITETNEILEVERNNETFIISFNIVLGTQGEKIGFIGYIWGFITSTAGVITLSVILFAYVAFITFSRINQETTAKGKELLKAYKAQKHEDRQREKMLKNFRKTDGFSAEDTVIIDGSMGDNLIELVAYTNTEKKGDVVSTYKYILSKVHSAYMTKGKLTKNDKIRISNVIEMCPITDKFDEDMQYKLIDLLLLEPIVEFDVDGFEKLSLKFLSKNIDKDDLLNFGSVLYVLLSRTEKLRRSELKRVALKFKEKADGVEASDLKDLSQRILDMFKKKANKIQ